MTEIQEKKNRHTPTGNSDFDVTRNLFFDWADMLKIIDDKIVNFTRELVPIERKWLEILELKNNRNRLLNIYV